MQTKNEPMRIIVVEDNESLRKGLCYRLEDEGYTVDAMEDGLVADEFLRSEGGDLVVLDINLPGQSGLDVLRAMRRRNDPRPVILLTARNETEDRVTGLDAGADDYLVKPFAMDELVARVRALGRRVLSDQFELVSGRTVALSLIRRKDPATQQVRRHDGS